MNLSKNFWVAVISICLCLLIVITIGFISFHNREPEIVEEEETGGYVNLKYTTETNALTIMKAVPMSDEDGMKNMTQGQYFDFSVDVNVNSAPKVEYEISVIKDKKTSSIDDNDVRIYLEKEESGTYTKVFGPEKYVPSKNFSDIGSELGSLVLYSTSKTKTCSENYRLRLWLSDKATTTEGSYSIEVDIHAIAK